MRRDEKSSGEMRRDENSCDEMRASDGMRKG
jgi:hypothetical protein